MKYRELKEKYKNRFSIRMAAGMLCVALAAGSIGAYCLHTGKLSATDAWIEEEERTAKADDTDAQKQESGLTDQLVSLLDTDTEQSTDAKEETVYLITDANGKVNQTIVSSWLKNGSANSEIRDVSDLSNIENVKGDETFTQNGREIVWHANGQDIYYRGTTDKEMPISEKVTYYLDGTKIAPKDLAGKSGKVTIRFDYTNHAKTTTKINGKKADIYVPFTVVSGMVLDEGFRNVRVNNGRILSDGNKIAIIGIAMPGLKESLNPDEHEFDDGFEFPEYVEVTADVENFSLEMTVTAAMAGLLSDGDMSDGLDFSELDRTLDDMSDAMGRLKDGGGELADGLDTFNDSMNGFSDGVNALASGIGAYTDGASGLADGIHTLSDSSDALEAGVNTLHASAKTISDGVRRLDQTLNTKMSEKEMAAVQKEVGRTVKAQFQKGADTYETIYQMAVQNFEKTMTNDAAVQTVRTGIQAGIQAQGLTSEGVVAALAQYYAANGFTDASGRSYSAEACQANVPGTETTYAAYFANAVLNGGLSSALADGITDGIASQGASAVGEAVTGACEMAATQAAQTAAVSGAESAKQQIAAAIEAKDEKSGHSLVSGTTALSEGTKQLADSVPALKNGIGQLVSGADQLTGNSAALKEGAAKLTDGAGQIGDGALKLGNGAHELCDGLDEFDQKAVQKMLDAYNGDVKELSERVKAVMRAGEDYRTFGGAPEHMDATTKFIFRTDGIK